MRNNIIIQTDCLKFMSNLPDKCVDLVFYDPPYNAKKKYDGYLDNLDVQDYKDWMYKVYSESERISKNGVVVYVGGKLTQMFFEIMKGAHLIIVHKRAAGAFAGNYMLQYHSLFSTRKPVRKTKDLWDDIRLPGEGYFFREPRYEHPGLTGLALTERVLEYFSNEGELVFDPFMGTGTTAVACQKMGRNFLGTEQSSKYIEIARQRLVELKEQKHG